MATKYPFKKIIQELNSMVATTDLSSLQGKWTKDLHTLDNVNKCLELFTLEGLPTGYDERQIKLALIMRGSLLAFNHETLGKQLLPYVREGGLNPLGFMTHARPVVNSELAPQFNRSYEIGVDCEILRTNDLEIPMLLYCDYFGTKLSEILAIIKKNNNWCKFPVVIKSSGDIDKDKKNALIVKECIGEDLAYPVITDSFQGVDIIASKSQYFGLELMRQYREIHNLFYEWAGVNHHEEKKERLTTDEVEQNSEQSDINSSKLINAMKSSLDKINKVLGWNMSVKFNFKDTNLYKLANQTIELSQGVR